MAEDTTPQDTAGRIQELASELEADLMAEKAPEKLRPIEAQLKALDSLIDKAITAENVDEIKRLMDQGRTIVNDEFNRVEVQRKYAQSYLEEATKEYGPESEEVAKAESALEVQEGALEEFAKYARQIDDYYDGLVAPSSKSAPKTQEQEDQEDQERAAGEGMTGTTPPSVVAKTETKPMSVQDHLNDLAVQIALIESQLTV